MALEGKLADLPLIDLLRVSQRTARSGRMLLWNTSEWAMLWLHQGQVVHALVLRQQDRRPVCAGEPALLKILRWQEGEFRFINPSQPDLYLVTIRRPTAELLVEAQELSAVASPQALPSGLTPETELRLLPHLTGESEVVHMSVEEWLVLTQIARHSRPAEIAGQIKADVARVIAISAHLVELGLVSYDAPDELIAHAIGADAPGAPAASATRLTRAIRRRIEELGSASA